MLVPPLHCRTARRPACRTLGARHCKCRCRTSQTVRLQHGIHVSTHRVSGCTAPNLMESYSLRPQRCPHRLDKIVRRWNANTGTSFSSLMGYCRQRSLGTYQLMTCCRRSWFSGSVSYPLLSCTCVCVFSLFHGFVLKGRNRSEIIIHYHEMKKDFESDVG